MLVTWSNSSHPQQCWNCTTYAQTDRWAARAKALVQSTLYLDIFRNFEVVWIVSVTFTVRDEWQRHHQQQLFTDRAVAQASHRGDAGSIPGQSMCDLWWTKCTATGFSSSTSLFPCQHGQCFIIIHSSYHRRCVTFSTEEMLNNT